MPQWSSETSRITMNRQETRSFTWTLMMGSGEQHTNKEIRNIQTQKMPPGNFFLHMKIEDGYQWASNKETNNFGFARWDTKDDANDQDNGFVCKRQIWSRKEK